MPARTTPNRRASGATTEPASDFALRPRDPEYLMALYFRSVADVPLLTADEEVALARKARKGDTAARERMIRANLRLVITIANDYVRYGLPLSDLINEGNVGLVRAVDRFDPERGARLGTYAAFWIRQSIRRALSTQLRTIRLPTGVIQRRTRLREATNRLAELLGREPNDWELATDLGIAEKDVRKWRLAGDTLATSMDAPLGTEGADERSMADILPDERALAPSTDLEQRSRHADVRELLDGLDRRERSILAARFGLDGQSEKTLHELGEQFGVTRERIRQLEAGALRKLRRALEASEAPPADALAHA